MTNTLMDRLKTISEFLPVNPNVLIVCTFPPMPPVNYGK